MFWSRYAAVTVTAALITLSGCSSEATEGREPPLETITVTDVRELTLPLDAYVANPEQERLLEQARAHLAVQCMQRFGFTITAAPAIPPKPLSLNQRRYGLAEQNDASRYGYRVPQTQGRIAEPDLTPEAKAVLRGTATKTPDGQQVPEGGCSGEARRTLTGGNEPSAQRDLADRLRAEALKKSEADSRVQAAFATWSQCMKAAGYDYSNPWQANDDRRFTGSTATPEEISIAVADVKCKTEVNLIQTWAGADAAYERQLINRHEEALQQAKAQLEAEIRHASQLRLS